MTRYNLLIPLASSLLTRKKWGCAMIRKGVEFTVMQVEPGLWKWEFQIDKTVTTGKTKSNLMGLAARRAQQRIDLELKKPRVLVR